MTRIFTLFFWCLSAGMVWAADGSEPEADPVFITGTDTDLSEFLWKKRPIVVFSDSDADPRFIQQMEALNARPEDLAERDVVVLTDTDPSNHSALREKYRPRGFMIMMVSKEGTVFLRKPFPWDLREITRAIDKQPLREREIRERREDAAAR